MPPVISVDNLSKNFIISHEGKEQYTALRDIVSQKAKRILSPSFVKNKQDSEYKEEFWALKNVSFNINQGERVGIIGRNGAGKSTLLKILSRITDPTKGEIRIKGRVASLLEVGTGFHPELTGRENVFLNGAILGMSRNEIRKKFDEIIDFAEVEQFLDTPVKRYSSGMYVRLAFAVAAHLEPEILVIDEVLAVGDAQFQKKCLGKMEDVSKNEGRTVLFVTHNMSAVKSLCTSAIILNKGQKTFQGDVFEALVQYMSIDSADANSSSNKFIRPAVKPDKNVYLAELELTDDPLLDYFCLQLNFLIIAQFAIKMAINLKLKDKMGFPVAAGFSFYEYPELHSLNPGANNILLKTTHLPLAIGQYSLTVELVIPGSEHLDVVEDCISFEISADNVSKRHYGITQSWGLGCIEIGFDDISKYND